MPFLKFNITKPWVSAKAGEEVSVISNDHFPVIIVENKEKIRFSVMDYELEETAPTVVEIIPQIQETKEVEPEIIIAKKEIKRVIAETKPVHKEKSVTVQQSTLF